MVLPKYYQYIVEFILGPIHMYKIYICKYCAIWNTYTYISKRIFTLCSHANSVHISILLGTHTCYRSVDF